MAFISLSSVGISDFFLFSASVFAVVFFVDFSCSLLSVVSDVIISSCSGVFSSNWNLLLVSTDGDVKFWSSFCVLGIGNISGIIFVSFSVVGC